MRSRRRTKPDRGPSQTVELMVETLGAQGDGIATWKGAPVFLPFTVPGDLVRAALGSPRGAGREARVLERLAAGPRRVAPLCRHFGRCGGCALQHLAVEDYQSVKLAGLDATLRRVGIETNVMAPLMTVAPQRRRARLGLTRPREPQAPATVGFRERFRHALVDLDECAVLAPELFALIAPLRQAASALAAPGCTTEVMLTRCDSGVDLLVESAEAPGLAALETLAMLAETHNLARVVWRHGSDDLPIVERRPVRVVFSGTAVPFPPGGFLQANAAAETLLVAEVLTAIGERRPALDLYAGLGTFTLALAGGGPVHAVEGDAAALAALGSAASHLPGVSAERRDLNREPLGVAELDRYAAVVFDPPRAGALRQTKMLAASRVPVVVAASCNPATFARDAAAMVAGGYRLDRIVPVDQFVFTPHLELVAVFRR